MPGDSSTDVVGDVGRWGFLIENFFGISPIWKKKREKTKEMVVN